MAHIVTIMEALDIPHTTDQHTPYKYRKPEKDGPCGFYVQKIHTGTAKLGTKGARDLCHNFGITKMGELDRSATSFGAN